jgi:hypothetical protein
VTRLVVGSTQYHMKWVPDAFTFGVKRLDREADNSQPSGSEVNMRGSVHSLPHETRKPTQISKKICTMKSGYVPSWRGT